MSKGLKTLVLDLDLEGFVELFPKFPGYFVNACGTVLSFHKGNKPKPRKWVINRGGYATLMLYDEHIRLHPVLIHRLVAQTFLTEPPEGTYEGRIEVNHKDGNKLNNNVSNLEWISQKENLHHAMRCGLHANPMKTVIGYNPVSGHGWFFRSQSEAQEYGFTQANVSKCILGERAFCKGYKWEHA